MSGGNRVSEMYYGTFGSRESQLHERERVHWVCGQVGGERVLEVGCSQGIVAVLLAREGFRVVGVEVEADSLEFAVGEWEREPEAVRERLEFRLTDGSLDEFEDESFDTVVMAELVEHLVQPGRLIDQVKRVLRTGGRLVVTTTVGLYPDPDHKESLFPSDLVGWFAEDFDYVDSTLVTFPLGRFNNIGLTMTKRAEPAGGSNRLSFLVPVLDVAERCLWEVQQGAETLRLRVVDLEGDLRGLREEVTRSHKELRRQTGELTAELRRRSEELTEAVRAQQVASGEVARLRVELEAEQQLLSAVYEEVDRLGIDDGPSPVESPRLDLEELAVRLAAAETKAAETRYALTRFRGRRGVRVSLAIAETVRHPVSVWRFPKRLVQALRRKSLPSPPAAQDPKKLLRKLTGDRSLLPRSPRPAYPGLRVVHWGAAATYGYVAPHQQLGTDWQQYMETGADLLLLEPGVAKPSTDSGVDVTAAAAAFQDAGIPVVLFARSNAHLELPVAAHTDLIVVEDERLTAAAGRRVGEDRVLAVLPSVDVSAFNPIGWQREPEQQTALFLTHPPRRPDLNHDGTVLIDPARRHLTVHSTADTTSPKELRRLPHQTANTLDQLAAIAKTHRVVIDTPQLHRSEAAYLRQILQLLATGTPVITTGSPNLGSLIDPHLIRIVETAADTTAALTELLEDPLTRERLSIQARQHVITHHSHLQRFEQLLTHLGIPTNPTPRVSILLVTNRPNFLEHAYTNIRHQAYPNKELVTVLHGDHFDPDQIDQLNTTLDFPTTVITAPNGWTLGDCLNAAVKAATGELITKMDDDDYYGPNHIQDLTTALHYSAADIVGKYAEFIYLADLDMTVLRETTSTERYQNHVAGATMMMRRSLARNLAYLRLDSAIDVTFYERAVAAGAVMFCTHPWDFVVHRHDSGHTWQPDHSHFLSAACETYPGLDLAAAYVGGADAEGV